jgi:hypothetical protein
MSGDFAGFAHHVARIAIALVIVAASQGSISGTRQEPISDRLQPLTPAGRIVLQNTIREAAVPYLCRPACESYRRDVEKFYSALGGTLAWIQDDRLGRQAMELAEVLRDAGGMGLDPGDYEGPLWAGRIERIRSSSLPAESDLIGFDVALTISAMRYVSDVHIGRVNPGTFHADLKADGMEFDLPQFLQQRLICSNNVAADLRALDPPFAAYERALSALRRYAELARREKGEPIPISTKLIKPGDVYEGGQQGAMLQPGRCTARNSLKQ